MPPLDLLTGQTALDQRLDQRGPLVPRNTQKCPALMDALYGPYAMYALDGTDVTTDRSGNARHLTTVSLKRGPDLREGVSCPSLAFKLTQGVLGVGTTWALNGALTIVCRAWFDGDVSRTQVVYQANFYPYAASPVRNVPFTLATVGPSGALLSYTQHGSNVADSYTSALIPPTAKWCFVSYRRAASGVLTIGIDQTYETSGAWPLPGTCQGVQLAIGDANDGIAPLKWGGGIADWACWDKRLSDAELEPLYKKAMAA